MIILISILGFVLIGGVVAAVLLLKKKAQTAKGDWYFPQWNIGMTVTEATKKFVSAQEIEKAIEGTIDFWLAQKSNKLERNPTKQEILDSISRYEVFMHDTTYLTLKDGSKVNAYADSILKEIHIATYSQYGKLTDAGYKARILSLIRHEFSHPIVIGTWSISGGTATHDLFARLKLGA
jgi:hypothetical protein